MKMRIHHSVRFLLLFFVMMAIPATSFAQFGVSITVAPPELVAYSQPICPQEGYLWMPGYWAYGPEGYFWVPGTWVEPPTVGVLWTPGYWRWRDGGYDWNEGYWGPTVGFYGGVDYGFGYGGSGYEGGYWRNNEFMYNRSANHIDDRNFHNTYQRAVRNERGGSRVSYNDGTGGTRARATAREEAAAHENHTPATGAQSGHQRAASGNRELLASVNHGRPPVAATSKPGELSGKGVVAAKGAAAGNKAAGNRATENKAATTRTSGNKAAEKSAAATRSNENKAAEKNAAATRSNENKAATQKAAQPAPSHVKTVAARPEAKPAHTSTASQPSHQSAPRAASTPQPPTQHQTAAKPEAAPKSEPSHQSKPSPEKRP
jgi:hypothetical protein